MYTIAVLTVCISLILLLGALAFLVSVVLVLLRTSAKAMAAVCGRFATNAAHFAGHLITQHQRHAWHTATR